MKRKQLPGFTYDPKRKRAILDGLDGAVAPPRRVRRGIAAAAAARADAGGVAIVREEEVHVGRLRAHVLGGVVDAVETGDEAPVCREEPFALFAELLALVVLGSLRVRRQRDDSFASPQHSPASAFFRVIPSESRKPSRSTSARLSYGHRRRPPCERPRRVSCTKAVKIVSMPGSQPMNVPSWLEKSCESSKNACSGWSCLCERRYWPFSNNTKARRIPASSSRRRKLDTLHSRTSRAAARRRSASSLEARSAGGQVLFGNRALRCRIYYSIRPIAVLQKSFAKKIVEPLKTSLEEPILPAGAILCAPRRRLRSAESLPPTGRNRVV